MRTLILGLAVVGLIVGCTIDEYFLSGQEIDELVENFDASVETQQQLSEYVFAAVRGEVDVNDFVYDEPDADNNWVGTLTADSFSGPWGQGSLQITFTVAGDNGPVDPYQEDLSDDSQVSLDAVVAFSGTSALGADVGVDADFSMVTTYNGEDSAITVVDGDFDITHNDYDVSFYADDLELTMDLAADEIIAAYGRLDGSVDIPDFKWGDAGFDLEGVGDAIEVSLDAIGDWLSYSISLDEIF
jgi:hypothetical protein